MEFDNVSVNNLATLPHQYIVTKVGNHRLAFPDSFVTGLLLIERSQVLALPFYDPAVLGIVHHQGQIVPLVALQQLLTSNPGPLPETFNVVQLSEQTGMAGLGLAIDRMLGNLSEEQVAADHTIKRFQPQMLDAELWYPHRWGMLTD